MADVALIFGVGTPNGLGGALARKFAAEGMTVVVTGRSQGKIEQTVSEILDSGHKAVAQVADVTNAEQIAAAFDRAEKEGDLKAVLYNAGNNAIIPFMDITPEVFRRFWELCTYGAFLVGQETVRRFLPETGAKKEGTLLFTGASASLRGKANFGHFSSAKAALRNMAQSMAREFGPQGLHVAHVIVDGVINGDRVREHFSEFLDQMGEDASLDPDEIATSFWYVHTQHRSAWTHELEVRPFKENW